MTQLQPAVEEIPERRAQGHAPERVVWESAGQGPPQIEVSVLDGGAVRPVMALAGRIDSIQTATGAVTTNYVPPLKR